MIEAIVFDFDGVMLDTETPDFQTWHEIYESHGIELTKENWAKVVGHINSDFDPAAFLVESAGLTIDVEELRAQRLNRFREIVYGSALMPGVEALINVCVENGIHLAVASNADSWWVRRHLENHKVIEHFGAIRTSEDVPKPKPAPDVYLAALEAIGVEPSRAIAFEDSPPGIASAHAAGIHTIAVPNSVTRHYDLGRAHRTIESIEHVTIDELMGWVADRIRRAI